MASNKGSDLKPIVAPTISAEQGRPDVPPVVPEEPLGTNPDEIDAGYWERCLSDSERAEKNWRQRGRQIIKIYRNDGYYTETGVRKTNKDVVFNILYSNTEVMLPNIYAQPPQPVVKSRFVKKSEPPQPAPPVPGGGLPGGLAPSLGPPGGPPMPPAPPVGPPGMGAGAPPGPPPMPNGAGPGGPMPMPAPPPQIAGPNTGGMMEGSPDLNIRITTEDTTAPPPPPMPEPQEPQPGPSPLAGPLQPAPPPPGMPAQNDIETAAAVMEKALDIVLDDTDSHEAVKAAVKDLLLPGRGIVRVRWKPQMAPDPVQPPSMLPGGAPAPQSPPDLVKIWETVNDEYVYWEDFLMDPVRQFGDTQWIAFRHLFDRKSLLKEFSDSAQLKTLEKAGKLDEILKWTEQDAAKSTVGGGGAMKTSDKLGGVIKKAMVWEIWDLNSREIIWLIRELSGVVLRVDPDSLGLEGFFPVPKPLLAVTTTDSMLPKPYYDLYAHLAEDLDETSRRISKLTEKIKVRGGYNAANRDVAQILTADDGKMIAIDGVDMMNGGLQNHIWLVPIVEWMNALKELYVAREQIKQAIYEVMGISDIMRGSSSPYETATAARIKGTMGTNRLDGTKQLAANFALELLKMKSEIIAKNFDAQTLTRMTGEEVTPAVEAILRDDFQRTCSIDIETDSTVAADEQAEQDGNAKIMGAMQGVLQGAQGMLMTGVLPPPMIIQFTLELIKMLIHPIRNSRGVVDLIDGFQEQLQTAMMTNPAIMMPPGPQPPPGGGPGGPPGGPPKGPPGGPGPNPGAPAPGPRMM